MAARGLVWPSAAGRVGEGHETHGDLSCASVRNGHRQRRPFGPWGSLPGAVENIRRLRRAGRLAGPVELRLAPGTHRLSAPLRLGPEDSGLAIIGDPGGRTVVSGGLRVESFREERLGGRRAWVAEFPDGWARQLDFRQLWVNGRRRPRARYPKFGYTPEGQANVLRMAEVRGMDRPNFLAGADYAFRPRPGDIRDWAGLHDAEIVALHLWVEERLTHPRLDLATGWVECARQSVFRLTEDMGTQPARYYIDNLREALTEPGEWFYAKREGRLVYLPLPGEKPATAEVVVPLATRLVEVAGNRYNQSKVAGDIHGSEPVRDVRFEHADWRQPHARYLEHDRLDTPVKPLTGSVQAAATIAAALEFRQAEDCTVEDCRIAHVGAAGIRFGPGARRCRATGNTLEDLGGGGVYVDGSELDGPAHGRTGHCSITDNIIRRAGRVFHSSVGVLIGNAFENVIAHNRIEDLFYSGISVGWSWGYKETVARDNLILNNRIRDVGQGLLSDLGAICVLGVQPGTVIAGNHISGVRLHAYGGWDVYLDEGSSHLLVEGNLVHDVQGPCFNIHFGRGNIVRGNLFIGGAGGIASTDLSEPHTAATFLQNVFIPVEGLVYSGGYAGCPGRSFRCAGNLIGRPQGRPLHFKQVRWSQPGKRPWREWTAAGHDALSSLFPLGPIPAAALADPAAADWKRLLGRRLAAHGIALPDWRACGPRPPSQRTPLAQPLTRRATRLEDLA